jgi:hypothetical protein
MNSIIFTGHGFFEDIIRDIFSTCIEKCGQICVLKTMRKSICKISSCANVQVTLLVADYQNCSLSL